MALYTSKGKIPVENSIQTSTFTLRQNKLHSPAVAVVQFACWVPGLGPQGPCFRPRHQPAAGRETSPHPQCPS